MNLLQKIASWFRRAFVRSKSAGERTYSSLVGLGYGWFGGWSSDRVAQANHMRGWNAVAIKAIAEAIAENPPQVAYRRTPGQFTEKLRREKRLLPGRSRMKALTNLQHGEELEPVESDHPLLRLLRNPNQPDVSWTFWYRVGMFLEIHGIAYIWVVPNGVRTEESPGGLPSELWVLPGQWLTARPGNGKLVDYYEAWGASGQQLIFPADQIIVISYPNPENPVDGLAPMVTGAAWSDIAESIESCRWNNFESGWVPQVAIELDKELHNPDPDMIKRIKAEIRAKYQGKRKTGEPVVLGPGAKATVLNQTPREMEYIQGSDQARDQVLANWRVSKTIAGITEEVNLASALAAEAGFHRRTIRPKLTLIGQVVTEKLARRFDVDLVIYWPDSTVQDPAQLLAENIGYLDKGVLVVNEVRADLGREPYANGGDDPFLPMGMTAIPLNSGDDLGGLEDLMAHAKPMPGQETSPGGEPSANGDGSVPATGVPATPDGQPEIDQTEHRADLLATVGGIQGALEILSQVAAGTITRETAIQMMVLFFGITVSDADALIGQTGQNQPLDQLGLDLGKRMRQLAWRLAHPRRNGKLAKRRKTW